MEFSIIYPCFGKGNILSENSNLKHLVDIQHENGKWMICVSHGVYTLFRKIFLLLHTALLKSFICSRVSTLDCPWLQQFLSRLPSIRSRWFLPFDQNSFLSFNLFTTYPQKSNHNKNRAYPNLVYSFFHGFDIYRLVKLLNSSFWYYF